MIKVSYADRQRMCRLAMRTALGSSVGLGTIATLLTLAALIPRPFRPALNPAAARIACTERIYLTSDRIHTNLIVPVTTPIFDWQQRIPLATLGQRQNQPYRYLQFGWGDRTFYMETPTWNDITLPNAAKALFWPTPAVLRIQGYVKLPQSREGFQVIAIDLRPEEYRSLMAFLDQAFQRTPQGQVQRIQAANHPDSSFYEATGRYSLFYTCNDWTAAALRTARLRTSLWTGLAPAVLRNLGQDCPPE